MVSYVVRFSFCSYCWVFVAFPLILKSLLQASDTQTGRHGPGRRPEHQHENGPRTALLPTHSPNKTLRPTPLVTPPHAAAVAGAGAGHGGELRSLAASLAGRFVPILTAIAFGRSVDCSSDGAVGRDVPGADGTVTDSTNNGVNNGSNNISSSNNGSSNSSNINKNTITSAITTPKVVTLSTFTPPPIGAVASPPTVLVCFAAECALSLTRAAAQVAVLPDPPTPPLGRGEVQEVKSEGWRRGAGGVEEEAGGEEKEGEGGEKRGSEAGLGATVAVEATAAENSDRKGAVRLLAGLATVSTIPLLDLAASWLGGGGEGGGRHRVHTVGGGVSSCGDGSISIVNRGGGGGEGLGVGSWSGGMMSSDLGGVGYYGCGYGYGGSGGGGWVGGGGDEGCDWKGLAVRAIRDLTALLASAVEMGLRLEELEKGRRRVLERDGLLEGKGKCDTPRGAGGATFRV